MQSLVTFARRVSIAPTLLACIALFILMVMTFFDVILRSVLNAPIEAATELTRILMAIMVFSVLPMISAGKGQIAVDLTDGVFSRLRLSRARDAVVYIVSGVMLIWPIKRVWILAERARDYGDVTEYLSIPVFYVGWFIAGFTAITAMAMIVTGLITIFSPQSLSETSQ